MTLTMSDLPWIVILTTQIFSFVAFFAVYKKRVDLLLKIVFDDRGRLNIIDARSCREHRQRMDNVHEDNKKDHEKIMNKVTEHGKVLFLIADKLRIENDGT